MRQRYEITRDLVRAKREKIKYETGILRGLKERTYTEQKALENDELVLKQSDTDLALIYENLVQMKHDQQRLDKMHPQDPELRTLRDRIRSYEEENEMLFNRLERWLYPVVTFVNAEEQEEAILFLDSPEWQRALHGALKDLN